MSQLAKTILSAAQALPEGSLLSAKEFLHLASRAAIDQTLSRLVRNGNLMRIGRGAYAGHTSITAKPCRWHTLHGERTLM